MATAYAVEPYLNEWVVFEYRDDSTGPADLVFTGTQAECEKYARDHETKRYEIRDQNGDVLDSFHNWTLALTYFNDWTGPNFPENAGACIFDTEDQTVKVSFDPKMEE